MRKPVTTQTRARRLVLDGGEAVVRGLEACGVDVVFGIPGTHSLPIYRHLAGSGIRHILPRHEQGAGFAADGYARASGRPGVCIVTTGPGVTNVATAAAQAYSDSVPVLIVSPGMPASVYRRDVGYVHETKDQSAAMQNLVTWSHRAESPADVVVRIRQAFDEFASRRPRPVHLEIPLDVFESTEEVAFSEAAPAQPAAARQPDIASAVALLRAAKRPGMVLGGGAQGASSEATALAHALGAIVATTANGTGAYPEHDELALGAVLNFAAGRVALAESDVLLVVGTELGDSDLEGAALESNGKVIRIDIDAGQLHKNLKADRAIHGDAREVLGHLRSELSPQDATQGRRRAAAARDRLSADVAAKAGDLAPFVEAISNSARDAIVVCDTSMLAWNGIIPARLVDRPRSCLNPTGYATLGYALPAAIGAKLAQPERDVVVVIGDGGILFTVAELATAVEQKLSLPVVVTNNRGYGEIRHGMETRGIEPIGVTFEAPNFAELASAFGAASARPPNAGALEDSIRTAFGAGRPTLIEVVT